MMAVQIYLPQGGACVLTFPDWVRDMVRAGKADLCFAEAPASDVQGALLLAKRGQGYFLVPTMPAIDAAEASCIAAQMNDLLGCGDSSIDDILSTLPPRRPGMQWELPHV